MSSQGKPKLRRFISPFFATRYLLRREVRKLAVQCGPEGSLIDIGCGEKPHRDLFPLIDRYEGIDSEDYSPNHDYPQGRPDFFFDPTYFSNGRLPFDDAGYDHAAAFEVIEHHPSPRLLLAEMRRVIRPGGYLFLTWPFIFPLHEEPHDYQRLTHHWLARTANELDLAVVAARRSGGLFTTAGTLLNYQLAMLHDRGGASKWAALALYPPFLIQQYAALCLDRCIPAPQTFLTYASALQKPR